MTPEQRAEAFVDSYFGTSPRSRRTHRADGITLAKQLRRAGIDLCMSRATEFSPRIKVLFLAAAKVAVLSHDPGAPELAPYMKDIERDDRAKAAVEKLRKRAGGA